MSDRSPSLPKYRHYKPKNLAVVRIDGHDHYLGRYDSPESREKYWRLVSEWNLTGVRPKPEAKGQDDPAAADPPAAPLTVAELILAFWKHGETYYRHADGTPTGELDNYRHAFRALKMLYGATPARDFGPKSLKLVRQSMVDAGLSRKVVNRRVQRLVHLFAYGVENELLPGEVHHALKAVKSLRKGRSQAKETEPVRPAPEHLIEAARPFMTRQVRAMVDLQHLTGMRSGEIVIMRTSDVVMAGPVWEYSPGRHKGEHIDKARVVFVGPRAQEVLRPWLRLGLEEFLFQPREAVAEQRAAKRALRRSPLTPSQRARRPKAQPRRAAGERYDSRAYAHAVARACRAAFPHPTLAKIRAKDLTAEQRAELAEWHRAHRWHPHQLRHNAATWLEREFGIEVARIALGHSSPVVTAIYAEADREKARDAIARVG
jgi:integrase